MCRIVLTQVSLILPSETVSSNTRFYDILRSLINVQPSLHVRSGAADGFVYEESPDTRSYTPRVSVSANRIPRLEHSQVYGPVLQ